MNQYHILTIVIVAAYLIGAIPFSFIIAKIAGVDIRTVGSGNVGATNVLRAAGKIPGVIAYALDIGKGVAVVIAAHMVFTAFVAPLCIALETSYPRWFLICAGFAAIIGHVFPIYLGFKGGKGVATSAGVMFILTPIPALCAIAFFLITLLLTKKTVSLASTAGVVTLPIFIAVFYNFVNPVFLWFFNTDTFGNFLSLLIFASVVCLFVVIRHIPNYKRLIKGEELGFGQKK